MEDTTKDGTPYTSHTETKTEVTSSSPAASPAPAESLWRNVQYRHWFTADTAAAMGQSMRSFAISLIAFALTQSLALAGWLGTATMIASQVSGVFGGTVVDRHDRRTLIIVNACCGVILWGLTFASLALHLLNFTAFAIITIAASTVNGLFGNATNAILRSIIPTAQYPKAQSLNQGRDSMISIAGSPIGGALYAIAPWLPFAVASLMFAISGVSATRLNTATRAGNGDNGGNGEDRSDRDDRDERNGHGDGTATAAKVTAKEPTATKRTPTARNSFFSDFLEGWRWMLRCRTLLALTLIAALVNFGINGIFSTVNLHLVGTHVDSVRIGFIETAMGVGTLLGALIAAKVTDRMPLGTGMVAVSAVALAALAPLLFSDAYPTILACALAVSLPIPVVNSLIMGFVFAKVPDEMQGRAGSTLGTLCMLPMMFCSAIAGSLLPHIGFSATIGLFWAALAVNVAIVLTVPSVRSIPAADRWDEVAL
ncbi:MFS transporter [Bifidobacterium avesanii]|uniref:MFS transporter n=1 Tax=Bifidobacterium avesanii TaxID=1798157 RepID=A0A7K3TFD0_9BIFI|nr:MFS transporter [Bifidobacterium avesanii]KAB8294364.1 Major Facilitator Superfamily [Bifidobacterium avesanii]NEG77801.1 MFS transporter [Bifidobacterium avesanii]